VATVPRQLPETDTKDYRVFVVSLCVLICIAVALLVQLNALGQPEAIYLVFVGAAVLSSLAFVLQPFANLTLALAYLISPVPSFLDVRYSAAITALLIGNCFAGCVLVGQFKNPFERHLLRIPAMLCLVAGCSALYGLARGNQAAFVLGDFYQVFEFSAMFLPARSLVQNEQQFRTLANAIVAAIIIASVLQTADVLRGANYLPHLNQQGFDVARTINMNAPIAFVTLLATLGVAKHKKWILAGMGILTVNLIWSFTRGLWLAAFASSVFLLIIQGGKLRRVVLKCIFAFCLLAIPLFSLSGLDSIVAERIGYSSQQFSSVSEEDQNISGRRMLEYILVLPHVAEHPIVGNGLGATFLIAGDAVLLGPKGEQIDFHYIHNLYLLIAFRLGIPALLVLLILLWKYFRRSTKKLRDVRLSPDTSALLAGLIAAIFGEVVLSVTSPTLLNHPTAGLLGCIMAITTTELRTNSKVTGSN
jgi:O-antigen ligase